MNGSPEDAAIIGNVTTLLNVQLRGQRCRVHSTELRVRVKATGLGTYPDVTVICGRFERDPDDRTGHTAINPRVIVEVLSLSTEDYDRGEKLSHYQTIPSLEEVVLVAHPGGAPATGPADPRILTRFVEAFLRGWRGALMPASTLGPSHSCGRARCAFVARS